MSREGMIPMTMFGYDIYLFLFFNVDFLLSLCLFHSKLDFKSMTKHNRNGFDICKNDSRQSNNENK